MNKLAGYQPLLRINTAEYLQLMFFINFVRLPCIKLQKRLTRIYLQQFILFRQNCTVYTVFGKKIQLPLNKPRLLFEGISRCLGRIVLLRVVTNDNYHYSAIFSLMRSLEFVHVR